MFLEACVDRVAQAPTVHRGSQPHNPSRGGTPVAGDDALVDAASAAQLAAFPVELEHGLEAHVRIQHDSQWAHVRQLVIAAVHDKNWAAAADTMRSHAAVWPASTRGAATGITAWIEAQRGGRVDFTAIISTLGAIESVPTFDPIWAAHLWRAARELAPADPEAHRQRALVFARLHRHLRAFDALTRAQAVAGPVEYVGWRKKSMPPPDYRGEVVLPPALLRAAQAAWRERDDAGPWDRVGVELKLAHRGAAKVELVRAGQTTALTDGATLTLRRLDLVRVTVGEVELDGGDGRLVRLRAGDVVALHELPARVPAAARDASAATVQAAADGDAAAEARVAEQLPWHVRAIRERLHAAGISGDARGKLQMWLVAFDE